MRRIIGLLTAVAALSVVLGCLAGCGPKVSKEKQMEEQRNGVNAQYQKQGGAPTGK